MAIPQSITAKHFESLAKPDSEQTDDARPITLVEYADEKHEEPSVRKFHWSIRVFAAVALIVSSWALIWLIVILLR